MAKVHIFKITTKRLKGFLSISCKRVTKTSEKDKKQALVLALF